ncbi:TrmB family transcriptional regulator [Haladaptatus pallidirubidus]|uniref:Transcription regulator TrmB N-terminal domain-containing protein n=2 Tax=Haladaptatus pallidirubidus TaxID=1008152 RepID=A0AAV3UNX4_9EURY|nr:helix-turn-helix domain-containing protein [Haladaptatus pallidirubidus]
MKELSNRQRAVELLQKLGLKEYEAKCFVALWRLPKGTAKEISETSDVPRTRVYDAIQVLEAKGFVEVQHSNPQQFRAVSVDEAAETLRQKYESRTETLIEAIEDIEPAASDADEEVTHEVWSLSGGSAIANRTQQLIDSANQEIIFVVAREDALTEELLEYLRTVQQTGISILIGAVDEPLRSRVQNELPDVRTFVSGLEWLNGSPPNQSDEVTISLLLLVDQNTILVSSIHEKNNNESEKERAVFGRGFDNGLVVIVRRLMATGLQSTDDS